MVTFEHLEKTETISAHGDKSELEWDVPLTSVSMSETSTEEPTEALNNKLLNVDESKSPAAAF